jgi:hypothetical protein
MQLLPGQKAAGQHKAQPLQEPKAGNQARRLVRVQAQAAATVAVAAVLLQEDKQFNIFCI